WRYEVYSAMARRVSPAHAQFLVRRRSTPASSGLKVCIRCNITVRNSGQGAETAGTAAHLEPQLGLNLCEQGIAPNDRPPAAAGQRRYLPARRGYACAFKQTFDKASTVVPMVSTVSAPRTSKASVLLLSHCSR